MWLCRGRWQCKCLLIFSLLVLSGSVSFGSGCGCVCKTVWLTWICVCVRDGLFFRCCCCWFCYLNLNNFGWCMFECSTSIEWNMYVSSTLYHVARSSKTIASSRRVVHLSPVIFANKLNVLNISSTENPYTYPTFHLVSWVLENRRRRFRI